MLVSLRAVRGNKGLLFRQTIEKGVWTEPFLELWSIQGQRYHTPALQQKSPLTPGIFWFSYKSTVWKMSVLGTPISSQNFRKNPMFSIYNIQERSKSDIEKTSESWRGLCKECAVSVKLRHLNMQISLLVHINLLGIFNLPKYVLWSHPKTLHLRVSQVTL